jgi:hypothetical protein
MTLWLRVVRALLFIKWVWVDLGTRSQVRLVFSLLIWVLCPMHWDTLLRLYDLRRGALFSLIAWVRSRLCCLGKLCIRLTLWRMNVNNCAGAYARTELRWSWRGFRLTWDWWEINWSMIGSIGRLHLWQTIVFEQFPEFGCVCVRVIMRQWTTWFGTVKDSGWKVIVSLMRLPRWMWVLGSPFVISVYWRSGVPWSVDWTSLEDLGWSSDDSAFLLYLNGWKCIHSDLKWLRSVVQSDFTSSLKNLKKKYFFGNWKKKKKKIVCSFKINKYFFLAW